MQPIVAVPRAGVQLTREFHACVVVRGGHCGGASHTPQTQPRYEPRTSDSAGDVITASSMACAKLQGRGGRGLLSTTPGLLLVISDLQTRPATAQATVYSIKEGVCARGGQRWLFFGGQTEWNLVASPGGGLRRKKARVRNRSQGSKCAHARQMKARLGGSQKCKPHFLRFQPRELSAVELLLSGSCFVAEEGRLSRASDSHDAARESGALTRGLGSWGLQGPWVRGLDQGP
jgi:hypothetical protein